MRLRTIGQKVRPSPQARVHLPHKKPAPFYLSAEWRTLMTAIISERFGSRANARCEDPECRTPHRRGIRIFGDHVVELRDGGAPLDRRNILCRCGSCHARKTATARAQRYGEGVGQSL